MSNCAKFNEMISLQLLNIYSILVAFSVLNLGIFKLLKLSQLLNIEFISVTKEVSNNSKFRELIFLQLLNIISISVTFSVFKPLKSKLSKF